MSIYQPRDKAGNVRSRTYLFDFKLKPKGSRVSQRFHGSTGQTAEKAAQRVEQRLKELAKTGQLSSAMTVAEACKKYWDQKMENVRSSDDQATNLEVISTYMGAETLLVSITPEMVADAAMRRARTPLRRFDRRTGEVRMTKIMPKLSTVNRQLIEPLRRLLRHAKLVWKVPIDLEEFDWSALRQPEAEEIMREITPSQEARYWQHIPESWEAIIEMYLISGRRKMDWVELQKSKVDLEAKIVRMPSRKKKKAGEAVVKLTAREVEIIREEIAKAPAIPLVFTYVARHGAHKGERRPITRDALRRVHETARKRAAMPELRIHDLRHTFGSRLMRQVRNPKLVQDAMGHSSIKSTVRYLHVLEDEVVTARSGMPVYRTGAEHAVFSLKKKTGND